MLSRVLREKREVLLSEMAPPLPNDVYNTQVLAHCDLHGAQNALDTPSGRAALYADLHHFINTGETK
jgi:hypothetical protein